MKFTAWITKYALTKGILIVEAERCAHDQGTIWYDVRWRTYAHGERVEWHLSLESAQAKAESMRLAKIASLKRQLAKLETMPISVVKFEVAE